MVAAIASSGSVDLFASHREPAWHGLGNVFSKEVTDSAEMLDLAGLSGWNVREAEIQIAGHEAARFVVPAKAIVADMRDSEGNPEIRVLGVTGDRYEIVQNEEAFAFLQSLKDGARWETAGAIKEGRVVFGSMAFERDFVLDPTGVADKVESYLLVYTSHDGSTGVAGGVTPVRVVCQNTLNAAIPGMRQTFKMRHTATVAERMAAEAELWRQANGYMDAFETEAAALYATKASDKAYFGIVESLFPKPEKDVKGALTKWEKRQEIFAQAWNGKPNAGIKGTAWGVFNALTEANQWGRNVRTGDKGSENFFAAGAGFDIPTNTFRSQALALAKAI